MTTICKLVVLSCALLVAACASISSMRSEEEITASLLNITPIGSTFAEVEAVARKKGWKDLKISPNRGYYDDSSHPERTVGKASITVTIGEHPWLPLGTEGAYAAWGFDENGRLIKIWVHKVIDSL